MARIKKTYLWKIATDRRLQCWPVGSTQLYFSDPTSAMPKEFVSRGKAGRDGITAPAPTRYDVLLKRGIISGGLASNKRGYFHFREPQKYNVALFVVSGKLDLRIDNKRVKIGEGAMLMIPAGHGASESVRGCECTVLWFNIANSARWKSAFADSTQTVCDGNFEDIKSTADTYLREVYSPTRSLVVLEKTADLLAELLYRRISQKSDTKNSHFTKLVSLIKTHKISAKSAARRLNFSLRELNGQCQKQFGASFAQERLKIKMERARKILDKQKSSLAKVAKEIGYASEFSFSRAFKRYFGSSPKNFYKIGE